MKSFVTIGITGGICSGKNTVAEMLRELGCVMLDTDTIVHDLYKTDEHIRREILTVFGRNVLDANGVIVRTKLAQIVFTDTNLLQRLNQIVHPRVRAVIDSYLAKQEEKQFKGCVGVLVPLLIENNRQSYFDSIALVIADTETRIKRCMERNGMSRQEVIARMRTQLSDEEKKHYADYIIDNNGSLEYTRKSVTEMYNNVVKLIHP